MWTNLNEWRGCVIKTTGRFQGYNTAKLQKDLIAGLIVGIVAIPLGMAFAIASGVRPENGIYTVIIAGILISLLGGSKYQIGGPTGAFVPILFGIVMQFGFENLLIAGFMAGILLVIMGLLKLGNLMKFIPKPVIIGFTAGIAVIIFSGQIANFFGLKNVERHQEFILNMREIVMRFNTISLSSLIVAITCLVVLLVTPKVLPKVPPPLLGLLISTVVGVLFFKGEIATIGSAYGDIPNKLPSFQFPELTMDKIVLLFPSAVVIALLGGIESLLSAVVADNLKGDGSKHHGNKELIGQGVANMAAPLFGGIAATGAIARTATNIRSGAVSPVSGIVHGVVVLIVLLALAPYASNIPLASMAPILMVVAWNMSERKEFAHVVKTKTADSAILLVTFLLTVFADLTIAVGAGLLLAFVLFIRKMSASLHIKKVVPSAISTKLKHDHAESPISMCKVEGALFFGATDVLEETVLNAYHKKTKIVILDMENVTYLDTSGEATLSTLMSRIEKQGGRIYLAGLQEQPRELLHRTGFVDRLEKHGVFQQAEDAIHAAEALLWSTTVKDKKGKTILRTT